MGIDKQGHRRGKRVQSMFGRLKDVRRIATRNDRCAVTFLATAARAATVIFRL